MYEKLVIVTRKTRLEGLIERFNTREQAKFYIEHMGLSFQDYDAEHAAYHAALKQLRRDLTGLLPKVQQIERGFLPTFLFTAQDLIVTVGQDGLVVNTAKYLDGQPIVAVNPEPERYDGILLPYRPTNVRVAVTRVLQGQARFHRITMGEVRLNDGQRLLAFNDFLVGQKTHVSARYSLTWRDTTEKQSSSGVLISTGAGSTGWLSSTQHMAAAVAGLCKKGKKAHFAPLKMEWDDPRLAFVVREPFQSRTSGVSLGAGFLEPGETLTFESLMPDGGVIFSDGVEADAIAFNAGAVATVQAADQQTLLVAA